jgi:hypothetical protein
MESCERLAFRRFFFVLSGVLRIQSKNKGDKPGKNV